MQESRQTQSVYAFQSYKSAVPFFSNSRARTAIISWWANNVGRRRVCRGGGGPDLKVNYEIFSRFLEGFKIAIGSDRSFLVTKQIPWCSGGRFYMSLWPLEDRLHSQMSPEMV